jgi:hypothetical protein
MKQLTFKSGVLVLMGLSVGMLGCEAPPKQAVKYPAGALKVVYEDATKPATCLVASVAMSANYLLKERSFSEALILEEFKHAGRDETAIADMKAYLAEKGLYLVTLSGRLDDVPPTGLKYWLEKRGYPVICIISHHPGGPEFNHAIVVIGICTNQKTGSVDSIYYFDPSSVEALYNMDAANFEELWERGEHAMLVIIKPPPKAGSAK